MKLALICLVGPLDRFGYQNTYAVALESYSLLADVIYLVSSTRNNANVDKIKAQFPKVVYISNSESWYKLDENGQEIFDIYQWETNHQIGFRNALQEGADAALLLSINMYIPEKAIATIYSRIEQMLAEQRPYEWLFRRFQLGSRLFVPNAGLPNIINLRMPRPYQVKYDWTESPDGEKVDITYGQIYKDAAPEAIVDCPMEMTVDDLRDKMNFTKSYAQLNPNAQQEFSIPTHLENYYLPKFLSIEITNDPLDRFGKMILKNHRPGFVSHYLLKKCRSPWRKLRTYQRNTVNYLTQKFSGLLSTIKNIWHKSRPFR